MRLIQVVEQRAAMHFLPEGRTCLYHQAPVARQRDRCADILLFAAGRPFGVFDGFEQARADSRPMRCADE